VSEDAPEPVSIARDHFAHLTREWSYYGPPLRPSPADTAIVERAARVLGPAARAAILGVTPEMFASRWRSDTLVMAVDNSPAMFGALWPPSIAPVGAAALLTDWRALPFADASLDLIAGDGCYIVFTYPHGYASLSGELARVLRPGASCIMRVFIRPAQAESEHALGQALARGEIGSVHALKLRLLACLHGRHGPGVGLDEAWSLWQRLPPLPAALRGQRGWTRNESSTLDSYRGLRARYYLPTADEFRASIIAAGLHEVSCEFADYELAERCPTFMLAPTEN